MEKRRNKFLSGLTRFVYQVGEFPEADSEETVKTISEEETDNFMEALRQLLEQSKSSVPGGVEMRTLEADCEKDGFKAGVIALKAAYYGSDRMNQVREAVVRAIENLVITRLRLNGAVELVKKLQLLKENEIVGIKYIKTILSNMTDQGKMGSHVMETVKQRFMTFFNISADGPGFFNAFWADEIEKVGKINVTKRLDEIVNAAKANSVSRVSKIMEEILEVVTQTIKTKAPRLAKIYPSLAEGLQKIANLSASESRALVSGIFKAGEVAETTAPAARSLGLGTKIAEAVQTGKIVPEIRKYGSVVYEVVRVGKEFFVREAGPAAGAAGRAVTAAGRAALNAGKVVIESPVVKSAGGAIKVGGRVAGTVYKSIPFVGAVLSIYDVYDQSAKFAQILESENKTGIADSMVSIIEHSRGEHAKQIAEAREEVDQAVNEKAVAQKLRYARNITADLISMINLFRVAPKSGSDRSWWDVAGDFAALPAQYMAEVMLGDPEELRREEERGKMITLSRDARRLMVQIREISPRIEEIEKTLYALEQAIQTAEVVGSGRVPSDIPTVAALTVSLREAREKALVGQPQRQEKISENGVPIEAKVEHELPLEVKLEVRRRIKNHQRRGVIPFKGRQFRFEYQASKDSAQAASAVISIVDAQNEIPWVVDL